MSYARRVDANQRLIVRALRAAGCFVFDCHSTGNGFPDLLVINRGLWLAEIKMPGEELTPKEKIFHEQAAAYGWHIEIWTSIDEALEAIQVELMDKSCVDNR